VRQEVTFVVHARRDEIEVGDVAGRLRQMNGSPARAICDTPGVMPAGT